LLLRGERDWRSGAPRLFGPNFLRVVPPTVTAGEESQGEAGFSAASLRNQQGGGAAGTNNIALIPTLTRLQFQRRAIQLRSDQLPRND